MSNNQGNRNYWISAAMLGVIFTGIINMFTTCNDIGVGNFNNILERQREEIDELRTTIARQDSIIELLREQVVSLQAQNTLHSAANIGFDIPMWFKGTDGKLKYCNAAYEKRLLAPYHRTASDVLNKTDIESWGTKTGGEFWARDLEVIYSGETFRGVVTVEDSMSKSFKQYWVVKTPVELNEIIIGVSGIAIDLAEIKAEIND